MNIKDVENLAELARIELSDEEKQALLKDLEGILTYVKTIEEVEVPDIKTEYTHYNSWREDLPRLTTVKAGEEEISEFSLELIKEQFPDSQDGFLKVKKIL
jgi:aspartyl-tRNA(Asn)/glutamyl-tRNA(Gln) amidotransferase subunit C